jgi:adenylosuccinate synthase
MPFTILTGLQWGDEGKGKMIDVLAADADAVARFSGGANAGHTVRIGESSFVLHQLPTGLLREGVAGMIGSSCVVDPVALMRELGELEEMGMAVGDRLRISGKVHLVHPAYRLLENREESARGEAAIGTTGRAIGPTYVAKFGRRGLRLEDAACRPDFEEMAGETAHRIAEELEMGSDRRAELMERTREFTSLSGELVSLAGDVSLAANGILDRGGLLFAEGAQGSLLDPDHGTYPFVTCGSCVSGAACVSLGVGPARVDEVVGVAKAYSTRVGSGPFPAELDDETGDRIREQGREYGATTGRPRRCGWLDGVLLRYAARLNGCHWIALTLLDVLSGFDSLQVCRRYELDPEVDAPIFETGRRLGRHTPIYETLPGWSGDISGETDWSSLPGEARDYVEYVEKLVGVPVKAVSTGPDRDHMIWRDVG